MKKIKGLIAALLLCAVALCCSGCAELDKMKACHAVWIDQGQTILKLNDVIYKKLPDNNYFEIWEYAAEDVYVTAADVPVLLAKQFGDRLGVSKNQVYLEGLFDSSDHAVYYCREDEYEDVLKQIVDGVALDLMIYDYWNLETDENLTYTLSAAQKKAVEAVLKTKPTSLGSNGYNEDYSVLLYRSSKNFLFREPLCTLSLFNGEYRLISFKDGEDFCYSVPAELKPQFEAMMDKYIAIYKY